SLHEFKTPPESSSAANSPVLPAKTVKNVEFAKSSTEVPVSAPSAALPENGERETPQKAGPVQDVTPATIPPQKPPEEVKVTQIEQASTKMHLVIPSHIQEVAEEQKNKIEPYLSTVIRPVTPSGLLPTPTVIPKDTVSTPKQQTKSPAVLPSAVLVTEKEGKQKKTLEAIPSTVGTVEQEQSKITKLPQLQAIPAIPSTSVSEEENEPHKVEFDALKEARNVVTATTRQIVKKEKVTNLPMRTVSPTIPLPSRAEEEKPKETKVPVSPAVSVVTPLKEPAPVFAIPVSPTIPLPGKAEEKKPKETKVPVSPAAPPLKEPTKVSAIKSVALPGSAEEEVKPKKVELLSTPFVLVAEKKHTKPDSEQGADSTFRYTIRSEGSQESEEEEK
ncbi:unnamed protein product, partial [Cylicostephanus goldi]